MMNDRIKLAEAMGIDHKRFVAHGKRMPFDPFTDADDDYAVLEWMRRSDGAATKHEKFKDALGEERSDLTPSFYLYEIGDYARAALRVLE